MKSPTASESASLMKNDYMSLRIQTQPSKKNTEAYSHTLYFGPLKEEHPDLPLDSTVHITNLPLDVSEEQLKCLFGVCGKVTKVIIGKSGTSSMSSLSSINGNMDPISQRIISEQGYIVFASCSSLKRLSKVKSNHWLPEKALPLGELRMHIL
ncbi:hypothetical protein HMI54_012075 [Coelomomyces lativittatus]|nr:hypothetical protein HMI54_012075 [Coelomomyces lativittatus]